jgi:hypothetical protein
MICPNCGAAMTAATLDAHLGTSVMIDVCHPCQVFWFDARESLRLSPGAVLKLFRIIGEQALERHGNVVGNPVCPRCGTRLLETHDQQRNTRFRYRRCPRNHGRLITFFEFLREKDFIKPLSARQIEELRKNVQIVNCSNCGAPIDLAADSACAHCGSPLSMLDMKQAGALVAELRAAEQATRTIDPTLPLRLLQARQQVESVFESFDRRPDWFEDVSKGGLVAAGLSSLARWIREQE